MKIEHRPTGEYASVPSSVSVLMVDNRLRALCIAPSFIGLDD